MYKFNLEITKYFFKQTKILINTKETKKNLSNMLAHHIQPTTKKKYALSEYILNPYKHRPYIDKRVAIFHKYIHFNKKKEKSFFYLYLACIHCCHDTIVSELPVLHLPQCR